MDSETYPAPYGRACSNCSHAKCKCLFPKAGGPCQRCQRLNKDCRRSQSYKRQSNRIAGHATVTRLEEKLENLVSLLRAGVQPSGTNLLNNALSTPESLDVSSQGSDLPPHASSNHLNSTDHVAGLFDPTPTADEECLAIFRDQLLPYFPCLYIPPETTAQQVKNHRPFTWLCITHVTSKHSGQRRVLQGKIKDIIAQRMVHGSGNTNLDLLLGLLIFLSWSNQQAYEKANINVFTQLVNAAVCELGLDNPSAKPKMMALCVFSQEDEEAQPPGQTMEERRAVLAAFFITSIISTFVQKTYALRWNPFLDGCLASLEEHPECSNDTILAQQVRFQLITERASAPSHTTEPARVPPAFYLHTMQTQAQKTRQALESESQAATIILLHQHYTTLTIHESALTGAPATPKPLDLQQLEHHYACLTAAKSWFDLFFTIPPKEYIGFPFLIFGQMVHSIIVLYQLSTFENPSWDLTTVRRTVDVLSILGNVVQNMSEVAAAAGLEGEPDGDIFSRVAKMYKPVQMGWGIKLAPDVFSEATQTGVSETLETTTDFLLSDNEWLSEMLSPAT